MWNHGNKDIKDFKIPDWMVTGDKRKTMVLPAHTVVKFDKARHLIQIAQDKPGAAREYGEGEEWKKIEVIYCEGSQYAGTRELLS